MKEFAQRIEDISTETQKLTEVPLAAVQKSPWLYHKRAFETLEDAEMLKREAERKLLRETRLMGSGISDALREFEEADQVLLGISGVFGELEKLKENGWKSQ